MRFDCDRRAGRAGHPRGSVGVVGRVVQLGPRISIASRRTSGSTASRNSSSAFGLASIPRSVRAVSSLRRSTGSFDHFSPKSAVGSATAPAACPDASAWVPAAVKVAATR